MRRSSSNGPSLARSNESRLQSIRGVQEVIPAPPTGRNGQARPAIKRRLEVRYCSIAKLELDPANARQHSPAQLKKLASSIQEFGFLIPVVVDGKDRVIAGHGRIEAVKKLGWAELPVIQAEHLTPAQAKAFQIADNKISTLSSWDARLLGAALKELSALDIDLDLTGFESAETDLLIQGLDILADDANAELADLPVKAGRAVSKPGDMWLCGAHRVLCADALNDESYARLLAGKKAQLIFTDPPYWVPIRGHVSGLGKTRHREFIQGSGPSTEGERISFFSNVLKLLAQHSVDGSIHIISMDFRHAYELLTAGRAAYTELKNLCVWAKNSAGMGSLYRSQHELFFIFKNGRKPHVNQVQLGKFGRSRSNVWQYDGMNSLGRRSDEGNLLAMHPTVKPLRLVQDAILDVSLRGHLVLDVFGGSGTTLIACERTGRSARLLELDPLYCDTIVRRYEASTGDSARHAVTGKAFRAIERTLQRG